MDEVHSLTSNLSILPFPSPEDQGLAGGLSRRGPLSVAREASLGEISDQGLLSTLQSLRMVFEEAEASGRKP